MNTIGIPIKNSVLANATELSTTEEVVTEEVEINEDKTIASEEAEQPTEEIQEEKEISEESTSAVAENAPSEQPPAEEMIDSKEEVKKSNQPVEAEKTIKKNVKAISPDKISVIFPDAALAEIIRDTLGKSSVDDIVTQAELDTITRVSEIYRGIADISGMENLTNLSSLYLNNNQISDISPLSNLTNLSYLSLYNNQTSDISPLSNLTNLSYLDLNNNQISDVSPLSNLTNLRSLALYSNQISDVSLLSNLTNLSDLNLHYNQISDISPLSNLTNLSYVDLDNNQISDISSLANLTNLENLYLNSNQISDISSLANLTNLEYLYQNNNQISDISPLSNLTNLRWLGLADQKISASKVKWNDPLSVTNAIKDNNGNLIAPSSISNQGAYTNPTITWTGLTNTPQSVSYSWSQSVTIGASTTTFNGTFTLPVEKSAQYNVNFDIDGQVTTELVEAGELVTKPQDPNKDGYAFIGWYDTETGGNKWDFSTDTMPANDMTLYARFNKLGFVTPEIKPSTPGSGGNQPPSNGSGSNTGNMTITSQENTKTSPEASEQSKLAQLGEQNSMILQGFGLLMVISGIAFFWWKRRKKVHS
ncbi:LPXTG cell wall anchor domain-containing protein [Listeria monocytogenes]|nr:LPXTG cell wall anchor domain-containing protein [Listeria monocytogenes]EHC6525715.1 LPXTG cell wall anchor domain-containing protein [Listeria monocytogenes]EHC6581570.1 LPXTG cell wall anchor domain-containing protein [Listeria monocytogenes]